jgi:pyruvate formate-lyase activating enzyme-like uncharacterized protein
MIDSAYYVEYKEYIPEVEHSTLKSKLNTPQISAEPPQVQKRQTLFIKFKKWWANLWRDEINLNTLERTKNNCDRITAYSNGVNALRFFHY